MRFQPHLWLCIAGLFHLGCASSDPVVDDDLAEAKGALSPAAAACVAAATATGDTTVCGSCECGSCTAETKACYASGDPAKDALCEALVACERKNGCTGDACYCGGSLICDTLPYGPCIKQINAAMGGSGIAKLRAVRQAASPMSPLVRGEALVGCSNQQCAIPCAPASSTCSVANDLACQDRICTLDAAREQQRAASAAIAANPVITQIAVNGAVVWQAGQTTAPSLQPGQTVTLTGSGFGKGPDIDFSKLMIGNEHVLETDLTMYNQLLDIIAQVNYEINLVRSTWGKDIQSWTDSQIVFRVPVHAKPGAQALQIQVQKRLPANDSLLRPGEKHLVVNAQTLRIKDTSFQHTCDVVSGVGPAVASAPITVNVTNSSYANLVSLGEKIYWSYDYNLGLAHHLRKMDWPKVLSGGATDPMTGQPADPLALFGAYPTVRGEVPDAAIDDVWFTPYPMQNPIPGFLLVTPQYTLGNTRGTGWAGFRYAVSSDPYAGPGEWIGFNCASCHGAKVTYEKSPGNTITRIQPGLPNPVWSMKWAVLGEFEGIKGTEPGPRWSPGSSAIDKTSLLYAVPQGAGEHTLVRMNGEGSSTDNDYQFSPIAIPNVTHYLGIRRSLSHTESYVGFEGSYIHSQEPDGAMGAMDAANLQALTAYMSTLDKNDDELRRVGMYRWLKDRGLLASEVGDVGEGAFVQAGWSSYPALQARIDSGKAIFEQRCGSCHSDRIGENTTETMVRLDQVGRFFAPTIYQKQVQSIRATFLRDLYWTQHRGLLSDGHVRNLQDLVDSARCTPGSALYDQYYTLHAPQDPGSPGPDFPAPVPSWNRRGDVFRIPVAPSSAPGDAGDQRNEFVERHRYFTRVAWDPDYYYWDYQKMRAEYGPAELGTAEPIGMPAAPHPWCAEPGDSVDDLLHYLLTL
jgi:hypothetical protein